MNNQLEHSLSPYLLQHKSNPVWWQPWGEAAFEKARLEEKPIFLSIGYATCHWCHVMEGDSFENQDVADLLNKNFIAIKVDREERPDVDAAMMRYLLATRGHGGWPLSAFLTPGGFPFWAGTFVPRQAFCDLLENVANIWSSPERGALEAAARNTTSWTESHSSPVEFQAMPQLDEINVIYVQSLHQSFDSSYGGFGPPPKFPQAPLLLSAMSLAAQNKDKELDEAICFTLDQMAAGGIYDHVGGGFHRYATDERWFVPHFEKMLYDNALLLWTYADAFKRYGHHRYKIICEAIARYMKRDLSSPDSGGFFSAEDADSEHVEGKFYTWTYDELKNALNAEDFSWLEKHSDLSKEGNFQVDARVATLERAAGLGELEHANILALSPSFFTHTDDTSEWSTYQRIMATLFDIRKHRIRPLCDDKMIAGWNGLALFAVAKAAQVFPEQNFLVTTSKLTQFILDHFVTEDARLRRCLRKGTPFGEACLEDYAYVILGLLEAQIHLKDKKITQVLSNLQTTQNDLFYSTKDYAYFEHSGLDQRLAHRGIEFFDHATPSPNAITLMNLVRLRLGFAMSQWLEIEQLLSKALRTRAGLHPRAHAASVLALNFQENANKGLVMCNESGCSLL